MTTILLARHGETDWNRERRWQGHADPPLNELGRRQAGELAEALVDEPLEAIYASDLRRAHETAEIVARRLELPVTVDPGLREIDVGSWSGLTREEIAERFPGQIDHDGEPRDAFRARVLGALERIANEHPDGSVLIVSHGGPLRVLKRSILRSEDVPLVANCEVYRARYRDGAFLLVD